MGTCGVIVYIYIYIDIYIFIYLFILKNIQNKKLWIITPNVIPFVGEFGLIIYRLENME